MLQGLTTEKALQILADVGPNAISEQKKKSIIWVFFSQLNNFLIYILLSASLISFYLGHIIDGTLIITIVVLNAFFGLYQEKKAEEAIKLLKNLSIFKVRVIRDGKEQEVDSVNLVPGDLIIVDEGAKIPADATILQTKHLELNESILTGESLPIVKTVGEDVFMGTLVSKGRAYITIKLTGSKTEFGKIASRLTEIAKVKTPLQKKLELLSKIIGIVGVVVSCGVFGLSTAMGLSQYQAFLLAVSLAVAIVPEGLPAVMTITLAIGIRELAKRKAIVRKMSSVEALGNVTLIATDKTGTITSNQMVVDKIYTDANTYKTDSFPYHDNRPYNQLALNGILCSTASLVQKHENAAFDILGDPTEGSLLLMAQNHGFDIKKIRQEWEVLDEFPFDSQTKRMGVKVKSKKNCITYVKGAPESVLTLCNTVQIGDKLESFTEKRKIESEAFMTKHAGGGYRVLAFAKREEKQLKNKITFESNYTFLGLVAIHDPIRPEVKDALKRAVDAGIQVVMITGDNEKTAEAIGTQAGLIKKGEEILLGAQLRNYSDKQLLELLPKIKIFARTSPLDKDRIVSLFQKLGHIVAVTGDGVNDAIALKRADVGIAMGKIGTDVARETADIVLADDNFASIVNAVEEGRNIVKKLKNAVSYLFSTNLSEVLALIVGLSLGIAEIFTAIQLLFINLIGDGMPALALAFSPKDDKVMQNKPQKNIAIVDSYDTKFIISVGVTAAALVLISYFLYGRTVAFTTLGIIQSFVLLDLWVSHGSFIKNLRLFKSPILLTAFLIPIITTFAIVHSSALAYLFKVDMLSTTTFFKSLFISGFVFVGIKLVRLIDWIGKKSDRIDGQN